MPHFIHLLVGDEPDPAALIDEWVNLDHVATVQHYLTAEPDSSQLLWLELQLLHGARRYLPVGPSLPERAVADADHAIQALLTTKDSDPAVAYRSA